MLIKRMQEDAYFVASNSAKGFYSYYPQCFDDARIDHVYAVKGGPGTGKSRFLREVADAGAAVGWRQEMIYCSSDPDSLDGVILSRGNRCIALLDATAPHLYEPSRPGAREDMVNLGIFWDSDALRAELEEIARLQAAQNEAYRNAYRYLAAYGELHAIGCGLLAPYIRRRAIAAYAARLVAALGEGRGFAEQTALWRSVGMQGEVGFDSYLRAAKRILSVKDCRGGAAYLMEAIYREAKAHGHTVRVSRDPIIPEEIDAILFLESGTLFIVGAPEDSEASYEILDLRRFADTASMHGIRAEINQVRRTKRTLLEGAIGALSGARDAHFALERIYANAMNFEAKETFTKIFCRELFDLQNP